MMFNVQVKKGISYASRESHKISSWECNFMTGPDIWGLPTTWPGAVIVVMVAHDIMRQWSLRTTYTTNKLKCLFSPSFTESSMDSNSLRKCSTSISLSCCALPTMVLRASNSDRTLSMLCWSSLTVSDSFETMVFRSLYSDFDLSFFRWTTVTVSDSLDKRFKFDSTDAPNSPCLILSDLTSSWSLATLDWISYTPAHSRWISSNWLSMDAMALFSWSVSENESGSLSDMRVATSLLKYHWCILHNI